MGETQLNKEERRGQVRFAVAGDPSLELRTNKQTYEAVLIDVSKGGLGVLLDPFPQIDEKLELRFAHLPEKTFEFVVKWVGDGRATKEFSGMENIRRCGLELVSDDTDLVDFFIHIQGVEIEE